jgi:glutathione synthase/RimK-type ligase-like ATP-grasp enzyme
MKKILLLGSKNNEGKNDITVINKHLANKSHVQVDVAYYEDLLFSIKSDSQAITNTANSQDIANHDLIIAFNWYKNGQSKLYRDVAFTIALYLQDRNVNFWNKEMLNQRSTSKLSTMMQLALAGMPIPVTYFSLNAAILKDQAHTFPLIVKAAAASRGKQNYLCKDHQELTDVLKNGSENNTFLMQEYIPNDSDYRVNCFDGKPKLVIQRSRLDNNTHVNNTSQGGQARVVDFSGLPDKVIEKCKEICYIMGRDMAGIDVLVSNDGSERVVFLEVNAIPQLTTGTYTEEKMQALADTLNQM